VICIVFTGSFWRLLFDSTLVAQKLHSYTSKSRIHLLVPSFWAMRFAPLAVVLPVVSNRAKVALLQERILLADTFANSNQN